MPEYDARRVPGVAPGLSQGALRAHHPAMDRPESGLLLVCPPSAQRTRCRRTDRSRYLNLCYGDPMFARNPSLGEGQGPGPRGGTKECRYLHFQVTPAEQPHAEPVPQLPIYLSQGMQDRLLFAGAKEGTGEPGGSETAGTSGKGKSKQAEWINCDIRSFDYSVLGQFQVIVADPPWDIHMAVSFALAIVFPIDLQTEQLTRTATIRHHDRRRDAAAPPPLSAARLGHPVSLGHRPGHGVGPRAVCPLGI